MPRWPGAMPMSSAHVFDGQPVWARVELSAPVVAAAVGGAPACDRRRLTAALRGALRHGVSQPALILASFVLPPKGGYGSFLRDVRRRKAERTARTLYAGAAAAVAVAVATLAEALRVAERVANDLAETIITRSSQEFAAPSIEINQDTVVPLIGMTSVAETQNNVHRHLTSMGFVMLQCRFYLKLKGATQAVCDKLQLHGPGGHGRGNYFARVSAEVWEELRSDGRTPRWEYNENAFFPISIKSIPDNQQDNWTVRIDDDDPPDEDDDDDEGSDAGETWDVPPEDICVYRMKKAHVDEVFDAFFAAAVQPTIGMKLVIAQQ